MTLVNRKIWSPNQSDRPNGIDSVVGLVLHHTATRGDSAIAVAEFFAKASAQVSAHLVVGDDGYCVQCVPLAKKAWHAGPAHYDWDHDGRIEAGEGETSVNSTSIGIEICNTGSLKDDFPVKQIRKVAAIIRYCDTKCPNLRLRDITDHEAVLPGYKIDMQPNFPAAKLFWLILHGANKSLPNNPYDELPRWAKKQVDEIRK